MIFITAKFRVRPEDADRWPEISREFTEATRAEAGLPVVRLVAQPGRPATSTSWSRRSATARPGARTCSRRTSRRRRLHLPPHLAETPRSSTSRCRARTGQSSARWRSASAASQRRAYLSEPPAVTSESKPQDARLLSLVERIDGNVNQRRALDYLSFQSMVEATRDCMAKHGMAYYDPFVDHLYGTVLASNEVTATAPLGSDALVMNIRAAADLARRDAAVDDWLPEGAVLEMGSPYGDAIRDCSSVGGTSGVRTARSTADALATDLRQILVEVNQDLNADKAYGSCMSDHGFDLDGEAGVAGLSALIAAKSPKIELIPPLDAGSESPEWVEFRSLHETGVAADLECRQDVHLVAMAMIEPLLDEFEEAHGSQLTAVDEGWAAVTAWSNNHGFDPNESPVIDYADAPDISLTKAPDEK